MSTEIHRIEFDRTMVGFADLADLAQALAILERLAMKETIVFAPARANHRDLMPRKRLARGTYRNEILNVLSTGAPMSSTDIRNATGFKAGTISGNLSPMLAEGLITKRFEDRGGRQTVVYEPA